MLCRIIDGYKDALGYIYFIVIYNLWLSKPNLVGGLAIHKVEGSK